MVDRIFQKYKMYGVKVMEEKQGEKDSLLDWVDKQKPINEKRKFHLEDEEKKIVERRKGPDILVKFVRASAVTAWIVFAASLVFVDMAMPQTESFWSKWFKTNVRTYWDTDWLKYFFYSSVFLSLLCFASLIVNSRRRRRRGDRYSFSLIFVGIMSVIGIAIYYIKFYQV